MTKTEDADLFFHSGYNCAQSVFAPYSETFGIEEDKALKISCGLGGGMGRTKNTCGAVSGAVLAISMVYGSDSSSNVDAKTKTYNKTREFIEEFKAQNGSDNCFELTKYDLNIPEQKAEFIKNDVHIKVCRKAVITASEILEKMLD